MPEQPPFLCETPWLEYFYQCHLEACTILVAKASTAARGSPWASQPPRRLRRGPAAGSVTSAHHGPRGPGVGAAAPGQTYGACLWRCGEWKSRRGRAVWLHGQAHSSLEPGHAPALCTWSDGWSSWGAAFGKHGNNKENRCSLLRHGRGKQAGAHWGACWPCI